MMKAAPAPPLTPIHPEDLILSGLGHATAWHAGQLYLSLVRHDAARKRVQRRILSWSAEADNWTELFASTDPVRSAQAKGLVAPATRILPTRGDGGPSLRFEFLSPLGPELFPLGRTGNSVAAAEFPDAPPSFESRVGCQADSQTSYEVSELGHLARRGPKNSYETTPLPSMPPDSAVSAMTVMSGDLYVAAANHARGFGLWKSALPAGDAEWTPVLADGAWRYSLNADVHALVPLKNSLLVAAGVSSDELSQTFDERFQADGCELLRVYKSGDWDILVGTPRFSPQGLKVPLSGSPAGFDEQPPLRFGFLVEDSGWCYFGGRNALGWHTLQSKDGETWTPAWPGFFTAFQEVRIVAVHPTGSGLVIVAETKDYEQNQLLQIWHGEHPPKSKSRKAA